MSKWSSLPTEQINPRTLSIDRMTSRQIVAAMSQEDARVVAAVAREAGRIARGIDLVARALHHGGRVFFVGAGTSGRLGVIEAAELPPTFGTPPDVARAIIAGGDAAVFRAREGAEDDFEDGVRQLTQAGASAKDVVVGISASGITEFVRGALTAARRARATRVFVTCWPKTGLQALVTLVIAPAVGPEVIAGSTRLKAGTATKMVLNMLTTGAMVKTGKTYGNLMVDVRTGSAKLKDRAARMVTTVTGVDPDRAAALLAAADWSVKTAIVMAQTGAPVQEARRALARADGRMQRALGEDLAPVLARRLRRPSRRSRR